MKRFVNAGSVALAASMLAQAAVAQVPVTDAANIAQAQQIASNTGAILQEDQQIKALSNQILQAVTGQRTSDAQGSGLSTAGLGGGNSVASAPSWGQLMQGGSMSWGSMSGSATSLASQIINGLQLIKSIAGVIKGVTSSSGSGGIDQAFQGAVNTATMLAALTDKASAGVTAREGALSQAAQSIGQTQDVKGSVDQNTQAQVQTAQTINQLIGVQNGAVAALNAQLIAKITQQSQVSQMLTYDASSSDPFK